MKFKKVKNKKMLKALKTVPKLSLVFKKTPIEKTMLDDGEKIAKFLRKVFSKDSFLIQEEIVIVLLNGNRMPLGFLNLVKGSQRQVVYDFKPIIQAVLLTGASGFIIAHNHPDDIKYPSSMDFDSSFALRHLTSLFGIDYVDNIILTHDDYYSMADESVIWQVD